MNFYEAQRDAARRSRVLVGLFLLVLALSAGILGALFAAFAGQPPPAPQGAPPDFWARIGHNPQLLLYGAAAVAGFILVVAGVQRARMGGSGAGVAEMLGGRRVDANAPDPAERRFVHVAHEMAIASGMPTPQLFVIPGDGINAFAAGTGAQSATVAVTEGALRKLRRAELQGVVAHEYGHLLSGDVRVNMRLMAMMAGLAALITFGRVLLYSAGAGRRGDGRSQGALLAVGLSMMAVGALSAGLGSLLRLALSRQREYAADAQAVRLTRNPQGIGRALVKLAAAGDAVDHPRAGEARQFFLSEGTDKVGAGGGKGGQGAAGAARLKKAGGGSLFATHPPLSSRIDRILPEWDGNLSAARKDLAAAEAASARAQDTATPRQKAAGQGGDASQAGQVAGLAAGLAPAQDDSAPATAPAAGAPLAAHMGQAQDGDGAQARQLLQHFPPELLAATEPGGAHLLALALLLPADPHGMADSPAGLWLRSELDPPQWAGVCALHRHLHACRREERLALLEMSAPALAAFSPPEASRLRRRMDALVRADGVVHLWEWIICDLADQALPGSDVRPARTGLRQAQLQLLALLALVGGASQGFAAGLAALGLPERPAPQVQFQPDRASATMQRIARSSLQARARFLDAAHACVQVDGKVSEDEAVMVRAIAARLDLPLPLSAL